MMVIENRVVSYTPLCLKVVISIIEPFQSEFGGGGEFRFLDLENQDPGQPFGSLKNTTAGDKWHYNIYKWSFYRHP